MPSRVLLEKSPIDLISLHKTNQSLPLYVFGVPALLPNSLLINSLPGLCDVFFWAIPLSIKAISVLIPSRANRMCPWISPFFRRSPTSMHRLFLPPFLFYLSSLQILVCLALPSLLWCINAGIPGLHFQQTPPSHLPLVQIPPPLMSLNFPLLF